MASVGNGVSVGNILTKVGARFLITYVNGVECLYCPKCDVYINRGVLFNLDKDDAIRILAQHIDCLQ